MYLPDSFVVNWWNGRGVLDIVSRPFPLYLYMPLLTPIHTAPVQSWASAKMLASEIWSKAEGCLKSVARALPMKVKNKTNIMIFGLFTLQI